MSPSAASSETQHPTRCSGLCDLLGRFPPVFVQKQTTVPSATRPHVPKAVDVPTEAPATGAAHRHAIGRRSALRCAIYKRLLVLRRSRPGPGGGLEQVTVNRMSVGNP